jgi:hypothetical protein
VKQSHLGRYEENAREKQKIQIYKIKHQFPSNQAIRMANTNFPPQISKARSIEEFGEDINQLSLGIDVSHLNISLLNVIFHEVMSPLKVSHSLMKN